MVTRVAISASSIKELVQGRCEKSKGGKQAHRKNGTFPTPTACEVIHLKGYTDCNDAPSYHNLSLSSSQGKLIFFLSS